MGNQWVVQCLARAPEDSMWRGRTALLWRLSAPEPTQREAYGTPSYWVQPEYRTKRHQLLKFDSEEAAEKWIIEHVMTEQRAPSDIRAVLLDTKRGGV